MKLLNNNSGWINSTRIKIYPRLFFIVFCLMLIMNFAFRDGWKGGFGQIIGSDFITLYSSGRQYLEDPNLIYDFEKQFQYQQSLINPTTPGGLNPFISPPYVASAYSVLTNISLTWSFFIWTLFMVIFAVASTFILASIIPDQLNKYGITYSQLIICVLSFFPFIASIQAGQNSGLTLFLMTCLIYFSIKNKELLAGLSAGLMIYKPQYLLGIIILWIIWRNYKALLGFVVVSIAWIGAFYLINGFELFQQYISLSQTLLLLPYIDGFPSSILVTLYGLFTTIFPPSTQPYLAKLSQIVLFSGSLALALIAYRYRNKTIIEKTPAIACAILLPLLATPYSLLHDLVILIPGLVLWARYNPSRELLLVIITVYLGTFILTFLGILSSIALNALLVIGLVFLVSKWIITKQAIPSASI